uniref:Sideroflexin 4 n=1 Tax=Anabas testudineus TaxID=64144 RepID=A0A7N5ZU72_ANATE
MDPNLLYWKSQGQSFISRLQIWVNLLDPTSLFCSDAQIQKARASLGSEGKSEKVRLCFFCIFTFLPISAPLVVASLLPHSSVKPAVFWQFLLQSYTAGFNCANRNSSAEQTPPLFLLHCFLLIAGTVSYATCAGALPQIFISRLGVRSAPVLTFFRSILPIPLSAALALLSVYTLRNEELETGIQVFDSNGNPVGISKAAGHKAVKETALSRAALFGTTAAVPNLLVLLLKRTKPFQRNPFLVAPFRHISVACVLGLMIPVSFSLFPQLGAIKKEKLEEELQVAAVDGHLFYHRGL